MDTDTAHGVNPKQLMNLLSIGADRELVCDHILNSDEEIKEFFQKLIHRKAPKESSIIDSILILLRENRAYQKTVIDRSLADLLLNPVTDLALLKAIKEYGKQIYQSTVSKGENSIALAIYYGAIASALVHHQEKISEHSLQTLKDAFESLTGKAWMVQELKELLTKAKKNCEKEIVT